MTNRSKLAADLFGKKIASIEYNEPSWYSGPDDLDIYAIHFDDGSKLILTGSGQMDVDCVSAFLQQPKFKKHISE